MPDRVKAAEKRARALTRDEVATVWVGLSEDELYVFRIALRMDGTGELGYIFLVGEPHVLPLVTWRYDSPSIALDVERLSRNKFGIDRLAGRIVGTSMRITVEGKDWGRRLQLRREAGLEGSWNKLRAAMNPLVK